jgi:predicted transcriptional regulator
MNNLPIIELKNLDDTMITIDDAAKITGKTKLTIQKKFSENKLETVAMLRTGKVGRPSRLYRRSDFNAIFNITTSAVQSVRENTETTIENDQDRIVASQGISPSP